MNDFDKQIAEIYREMELQLVQSMQRNLGRHLAEEVKTGLQYPQWQAMKLKELKRYQRQNQQIINSSTNGLSQRVSEQMKRELTQGSLHELKRYREAMGSGYKSTRLMKDSFFKVNDRKVTSMITALTDDLTTANTAVLRMMNDTYRQTIFKAGMFASNGVMTEQQAYDMAVKDFLKRGINCIEYKDGRRVNIADYASMAVRTANQRAYMAGEGEFRKEIGETLVIISKHNTACELCQPFETKVLIDDVYSGGKAEDGDYMLLSEAMKLGLFHPRCRHGLGTYYPELEEINHYDNEQNHVDEYGDADINAAHVANMIQRYKRLSSGSVDPDNVTRYQERLKYWENKETQAELQSVQNNATMSSEVNKFTSIVGKQRGMYSDYLSEITDRFSNGSGAAQRAFNKYVRKNSVADSYYKGTDCFSPTDGKVHMNFSRDFSNPRGAGVTYFHEHGHLIDYKSAKGKSYSSVSRSSFESALQSDFNNYIQRYMQAHSVSQAEAYSQITAALSGAKNSAVSDLFGGLSGNQCAGYGNIGCYGHRTSYWKSGSVPKEAFAHMFEAQFDVDRYALMIQYFPSALTEFESVLKGLV